MADTLLSSNIELSKVSDLHVYHSLLTYQEIAAILKFQDVASSVMGVSAINPFTGVKPDVHINMITDVFNGLDSEPLKVTYNTANKFQYLKVGNTILMVVGSQEDANIPGWKLSKGNTFSAALLKTIYEQVGYLDVHSGPVVNPWPGEFTLADVFKLIDLQNP